MSQDCTVIYNGSCPICTREIALYKRRADASGADVAFVDLTQAGLEAYGLTEDQAAREMHVVVDGQLISGIEAFAAMWDRLPGLRWLARLVRLPVLRPLAGLAYRYVAAPVLYRMHRRRQSLQRRGSSRPL